MQTWLEAQGVRLVTGCKVTDLDHKTEDGQFIVTGTHCLRQDKNEVIAVNDGDLVFMQNGSMTDASSLGSMTSPPRKPTKADKPMAECNGAEILRELCGHLRFDFETVESASCIP